ncbi:hypothetical protein EVAR_28494_1 [Eumeta japonica]|uniref:Uncharacterized protein n=1 Tax=Eumeta variegata TaxID=151549 RepID=A0A4C1WRG8_EUMVA|nr:hypothetical protein EVAR_28494_1 [Eumeta japonica]
MIVECGRRRETAGRPPPSLSRAPRRHLALSPPEVASLMDAYALFTLDSNKRIIYYFSRARIIDTDPRIHTIFKRDTDAAVPLGRPAPARGRARPLSVAHVADRFSGAGG